MTTSGLTEPKDAIKALFLEIESKDMLTALDCNFLNWCYGFELDLCYEVYDDLVYSDQFHLVEIDGKNGWKLTGMAQAGGE